MSKNPIFCLQCTSRDLFRTGAMGAWQPWNFEIVYKRTYDNHSFMSLVLYNSTRGMKLLKRTLNG